MSRTPHRARNHRSAWTAKELHYVEMHYGTLPTADIAYRLGRTPAAIRLAAAKLGCNHRQNPEWSAEELAILQTHYADGAGITRIQLLLPGRTRKTIFEMARKMGVASGRGWNAAEQQLLQQCYPIQGTAVAEKLPGRTPEAIRLKAASLGLKYCSNSRSSSRRWRQEELTLLARNLTLPLEALVQLFPGRSRASVRRARERLRKKSTAS